MDVKLLYSPGDRKFRSVEEKMLEWEPCHRWGWAPRPSVEQPRRTGKKCCYSQKSGVGRQYVAVLFSLQLTSHTQPFQQSERYIFMKNCVRSSLLCWIFSVCICIRIVGCDYTTVVAIKKWAFRFFQFSTSFPNLMFLSRYIMICKQIVCR